MHTILGQYLATVDTVIATGQAPVTCECDQVWMGAWRCEYVHKDHVSTHIHAERFVCILV